MKLNKKKILVSAQDAGGAANIAPICRKLLKENFDVKIYSSSYTIKIFKNYDLDFHLIKQDDFNEAIIDKFFCDFNPDLILTGTSRYYGIDRYLIKLAKRYNKFSISIIDDWVNYIIRFLDYNGSLLLPDIICCIDKICYDEAINEGLPVKLLRITGSPYLSELFDKKTDFINNNIKNTEEHLPKILFISETLSDDHGSNYLGGPLGQFLGYTENSTLKDLFQCCKKLEKRVTLIEKPHPSSKNRKHKNFVYENVSYIRLRPDEDLIKVIMDADLVIGMRSIGLLVSAIFDKLTVSYQPNLNNNIPKSSAEKIAGIERIENIEDLFKFLSNWLNNDKNFRRVYFKERPIFADKDSINNIVSIIKSF